MNGGDIETILLKTLGDQFKGVFCFDVWRSLKLSKPPAAYVFNTQPSSVKFGHWIAIFIQKNGKAIFFDSFGRSPANLGFLDFLEKHSKTWSYSNVTVQNPFTAVCGQHVICFLLKVCCSGTNAWRKLFSSDLLSNDNLVYKTIKNKFKIQAPLFPDFHFFM